MADTETRYFNRELSWLAFNRRVLAEARNATYPLLERVRFLSISGDNLDEFFMVRVAGLKGQQLQDVGEISLDGMTVAQQLTAIVEQTDALLTEQQRTWADLRAELAANDIRVLEEADIGAEAGRWLDRHFLDHVFPILTPQALDPSHPFPFVPNQGVGMIFDLERERDGEGVRELVLIPSATPRLIRIEGTACFVAVETMLRRNAARLFPGFRVGATGVFRVTRDSDIEVEEEAEDLVRYFRSAIKRRRRGRVIRIEFEAGIAPAIEAMVNRELGGASAVIAERADFVGIGALDAIVEEDRPDLKFAPFVPRFPERIRQYDGDCFAAIRAKDIVVHHPYESFDVVLAFLRQAAADPDVVAIKQTLYRAGKQPTVIRALCDAAEAGKSVTAIVELKARFDEEQNLLWASQLERSGVQVVYGFIDWKTHAKVSMVVRRENGSFRTYCHFGTGNYHPQTARIYTDLSFFTADAAIGRDAAKMFNYVTGYVEPGAMESLTISPHDLRQALLRLIDAEIVAARSGRGSGIWAKMNSLVDREVIDKLYEASAAGVPVDLVVRGICCLRPGVEGLSETIKVRSIVGRFLEHSRIWAFGNGASLPGDGAKVYISSADWMPRNFDRRVEYMLPICNETVHDQVLDQVMLANLLDTEQSWELRPNGDYVRDKSGKPFNLHRYFMTNPSLSGRGEASDATGVPTLVRPVAA